jgi:hypothetical protein
LEATSSAPPIHLFTAAAIARPVRLLVRRPAARRCRVGTLSPQSHECQSSDEHHQMNIMSDEHHQMNRLALGVKSPLDRLCVVTRQTRA